MKLIVGLGNVGREYDHTRHNVGFEVVDAIVAAQKESWTTSAKHHAHIARIRVDEIDIHLAKPATFMNLSGRAVQSLAQFYKIDPQDILLIHDDMDLAPGSFAFIAKGGNAGHNGVASVQDTFGRNDIPRLRIGIGRPQGQQPKEDWVLGRFQQDERDLVAPTITDASAAALDWARHGIAQAMNVWHAGKK